MKQILLLLFVSVAIFSCNNSKPAEPLADSTTKKATYNYPFTAKYSLNWRPGDENNAVLVLNSMKKYMDGDIKGSFDYIADSIEFITDKFHFNGKKDSLMAMMIPMRANVGSMSMQPDTWMTVYYPDKGDTWVTIWSTQKWTDKKGKTDSIYYTDDVLVKNGKITQIDEKQRMFPEPTAKK